jgi:hypothetical protein
MNSRGARAPALLAAVGVCGLLALGSLVLPPALANARSSLAPGPGATQSSLTPLVGEGGNIATACNDVTTCTTGAIAAVTAGDTLIVVVTEFTTSAGAPSLVEEVTSGGDNDLTELGATPCVTGSGHGVTAIYGLADVAAEASVTFTVTYTDAEYYTIHALDVKGTTASPFEAAGTGVCSGASGTTGTATVTTTVADDLVVLGVEVRASTAVSATGGDTLVNDAATTGADLDSGGLLVKLDAATGPISLSATFTNDSWSALAVALKTSPLAPGTVSPTTPTVDAGQTVTLTSTAATGGTAPITYQWYTATSTSGCGSGIAIVGATGGSYVTPGLSEGNFYYCVWATDSSTPTPQVAYSNVANVTVNPALSITIAPGAPSLARGQTLQLNSTPSGGTEAYRYAWYSTGSCTGTVLATTQNYTPPGLTATTTYCVVVTDSSYSPESANATVTVTVLPPASPSSSLPPYVYPVIGVLIAVAVGLLLLGLLRRRGARVVFTQAGLATNTAWSLTLDGVPTRSTGSTITLTAAKGKHEYAVQPVAGYTVSPVSGTVEAGKGSVDVKLTFTKQAP